MGEHIDNCYSNIDAVQLDMGSGNYVNNDQYYYDNGHKFAFNYVDTQFSDLLPISLRILFKDNSYVDLENIIADLGGNSVFQSAKTCDNGNATPAPTTSVFVEETVDLGEETTASDMDTTVCINYPVQCPLVFMARCIRCWCCWLGFVCRIISF